MGGMLCALYVYFVLYVPLLLFFLFVFFSFLSSVVLGLTIAVGSVQAAILPLH